MMRDTAATLIGTLAVLLVLGGWAIVETNTGPFEHELAPAEHATELEGTYVVRDGAASSPVCRSPGTEQTCDPETELAIELAGLPRLGEQAAYAAFLADDQRLEPLGALEASGGAHELAFTGDVDGDDYGTLMLALADAEDTTTPAFELHAWALPTSGGEMIPLEEGAPIQLAPAEGHLNLAQIGAVEVAITAETRLTGLPAPGGWSYEAWLVDDEVDRWTALGELEADEQGGYALDARVERVTLADQDRLLVTLEPPAATASGVPGGFPVVGTAVQADSLLG